MQLILRIIEELETRLSPLLVTGKLKIKNVNLLRAVLQCSWKDLSASR